MDLKVKGFDERVFGLLALIHEQNPMPNRRFFFWIYVDPRI